MADYERKVLEFYQLERPYPTTWPADKNEPNSSDDDDDDLAGNGNGKNNGKSKRSGNDNDADRKRDNLARRKSRYQALERAVSSRRSFIPGSEQSGAGGSVNLVQKDEPDPLGTTDSVVRALRMMRLPVKDDVRLRRLARAGGTDGGEMGSFTKTEREADGSMPCAFCFF